MGFKRHGRRLGLGLTLSASLTCLMVVAPFAGLAQDVLPRPEPPFKGVIGETYKDSTAGQDSS